MASSNFKRLFKAVHSNHGDIDGAIKEIVNMDAPETALGLLCKKATEADQTAIPALAKLVDALDPRIRQIVEDIQGTADNEKREESDIPKKAALHKLAMALTGGPIKLRPLTARAIPGRPPPLSSIAPASHIDSGVGMQMAQPRVATVASQLTQKPVRQIEQMPENIKNALRELVRARGDGLAKATLAITANRSQPWDPNKTPRLIKEITQSDLAKKFAGI